MNDDPIAKALAERLVAMSASDGWLTSLIPGASPQARARTLPMSASALDSAIASGRLYAYVMAAPKSQTWSCGLAWNGSIIPLIDSRPYAVIRRGVPELEIDGEGLVRLHPVVPSQP